MLLGGISWYTNTTRRVIWRLLQSDVELAVGRQ